MFDVAISSAKWIVDTLIQRRNQNKSISREKWIQVADYLENIAKLIDESINYLKNDEIPYRNFAHLMTVSENFGDVLKQVYDNKKKANIIGEYESRLLNALDMFSLLDVVTAEISLAKSQGNYDENMSIKLDGYGLRFYSSLSITAGQFHGAASNIRALA